MSRPGVSRFLAFCSKDRNKTSYRFCRRSMVTLCKVKKRDRTDWTGWDTLLRLRAGHRVGVQEPLSYSLGSLLWCLKKGKVDY